MLDTYPHGGYSRWLKKLFPRLRDPILIQARAEGEPRSCYPGNLSVAMHNE